MTSAQTPSEEKKSTHPLIWAAVGCAGLVLVGAIAAAVAGWLFFHRAKNVVKEMQVNPVVATARLIAAANPEIELVEADEEKRVVTFRNTRTGEELTFDFDEVEEGKIRFSSGDESASVELEGGERGQGGSLTITTDEGRARFGAGAGELPSWLPLYPDATPQGTYTSETSEARSSAYTIETQATLDEVLDFYVTELEGKGFEIVQRTATTEGAFVTARTPDESLMVNVAVSSKDGKTQAVVNYTEK